MSGARGLARWRVPAAYPLALVCLWLADPAPVWLAAGAVVGAAGLLLRGWAAGHLRKHERLATTGPYACTRNPLYFGSLLLAAGFAIAARSWWVAALVAGYFAAFYPAVMRREERELAERYGEAFTEYARRVPLFWPWPRAAPAGEFSWEMYRRNREHRAALGFAAVVALLALRMWLGE